MKKNLILIGLILCFAVAIYTLLIFRDNKVSKVENTANTESQIYSQLDGLAVASTTEVVPAIVGVMVDNHPDARPQFGVSAAAVVYEAPVEGDFTRLFLVFNRDSNVQKVGPVRSARSYFLDWRAEYGALYLHCGGSPEALARIKKEDIFAANEFYWGKYYWRDNNFTAPHNLFTGSENWQKLWQADGPSTTPVWVGWNFSLVVPTSSNASVFVVDYGLGYKVEWHYDAAVGKYYRFLGGEKQFDGSGEEIALDNVIVQYTKTVIVDDYGRKEIQTVGNGSARIFRDGKIVIGTWTKASVNDRTHFWNESGEEIKLKPGKTWLQIVPDTGSVTVSS